MLNHKRWFAGTSGVLAIASTLLLIACSGDGSDKLPTTGATLGTDTYAPTVVISGHKPEAVTGGFTLTFTFNEQIRTEGADAFTAADIVVSAGTKGTLAVTAQNANSQTVATLPITPPANSEGTITVSIPTGAFMDMEGNVNTVATISVEQTYETTVAPIDPAYLFRTSGGAADVTVDTSDNWGTGTTITLNHSGDATYNPCIQVIGATGQWGNAIVFNWGASTFKPAPANYTSFQFKVKSSTVTSLWVKFPEYEKSYPLSGGTALANGWVQMTIPMSDFTSHTGTGATDFRPGDGRVAIFEKDPDTNNTFLLTDLAFVDLID